MMRKPTPAQSIRLTDQQTLHDTMIVARRHIPLTANGYRCQTADLWRLLLAAAARHSTIEATCADLPAAPDANTVRDHLSEQLPPAGIPDLEQHWNVLLWTLLPDWLRQRPQELAIDFPDEPYYGQQQGQGSDTWVCLWDRDGLPTDGAGASAHEYAQSGAALGADGGGAVDRQGSACIGCSYACRAVECGVWHVGTFSSIG